MQIVSRSQDFDSGQNDKGPPTAPSLVQVRGSIRLLLERKCLHSVLCNYCALQVCHIQVVSAGQAALPNGTGAAHGGLPNSMAYADTNGHAGHYNSTEPAASSPMDSMARLTPHDTHLTAAKQAAQGDKGPVCCSCAWQNVASPIVSACTCRWAHTGSSEGAACLRQGARPGAQRIGRALQCSRSGCGQH